MDLITQDSYEKRGKQSTIPPALAKEKEIKKEPIQKLQPRNNRKKTEIPTKNLNCGFCGQQNWSPSHKCPAKTVESNTCRKMVTLREYAAVKPITTNENKKSTTWKKHTPKRKKANQRKYNTSHKSTEYYPMKTTITGSN